MAERTPPARNRYADFLRALSIGAVVFGHWLIAAPHVTEAGASLGHMLSVSPWTQWLTWGFQVMPVFFMVGGYSNAASWTAAERSGQPYAVWLSGRIRRLIGPLLPLLAFWVLLGAVGHLAGVSAAMIRIGSQAALVPVWFLAVYVLVVVLVPPTHRAWQRWGFASFWGLAVAAIGVDVAVFVGGWRWLGWSNYLFVWLAVHQLGYAWRDERLGGSRRSLPWALGGVVVLWALVTLAGYPRSMVGVPGEEVSNTLPPTLAMLALGAFQGGLVLAMERPARRWLQRVGPWTSTILVNSMIMSVYLWHLTVMVLVIGLSVLLGGPGLGLQPGSGRWWATRPLWMILLAVLLIPFIAVFARFERASGKKVETAVPAWRLVVGAMMVCGGLALVALDGVGGKGPAGIRWIVLLPFAGVILANAGRPRRNASAGAAIPRGWADPGP